MIKANINEIKAKFSYYVNLASKGETVIICNHNIPVAEIKATESTTERKKIRRFGAYVENINIPEDFNETSQDIIDSFYNSDNDEEFFGTKK